MLRILFLFLFCHCLFAGQAKPLDIIFWHSLSGQLGQELKDIAEQFNASQPEYRIVPIFKGEYRDTLTAFASAFRAGLPPDLIQVYEVGTPLMMYPPSVIEPVSVVMGNAANQNYNITFMQSLGDRYRMGDKWMAMPFNISLPVMFYNQDLLIKLGLPPRMFPKTWDEFEVLAKKIKKSHGCTYTTAYPAWILIEAYMAVEGLVTENNTEAMPSALIAFLKRLRHWQLQGYFEYGGLEDDATVLFTSGHCAVISQSSGAYHALKQAVQFKVGVAPLPLDTAVSNKRYRNIVGGAALWVVSGRTSKTQEGIKAFINFFLLPEIQKKWHENTGYLMIEKTSSTSIDAIEAIANDDLNTSAPIEMTRVQNALPSYQLRLIYDEALEAIFSGMDTPEQATAKAYIKRQQAVKRFLHNTGRGE